MKKLLLIVCYTFLLAGCNDNQTPKSTVTEFLQLVDNLELEKAKKLLVTTPENKAAIESIEKYAASLPEAQKQELINKGKNRVYNIVEKETSETSATIFATNNEASFISVIRFELIKQDGKWYIKTYDPDAG